MQKWDSRPEKPDKGQWIALGVSLAIIAAVIIIELF